MMAGARLHIVLLILTVVCSCLADPVIVSTAETVSVYSGQTAVLRCKVQDVGRNKVSWSSVSRNFVIYEGKQLMADDVIKYSLLDVPEGSVYDLQILTVEKSDQGFYKCAIDGTEQQIITHLDVMDMPDIALPTGDPLNLTDCCIAENMSSTCLPACYPDQIDLDVFDALNSCGSLEDVRALGRCFTAGSNHDNCCLVRGVDPLCLDFCHNNIPDVFPPSSLATCTSAENINKIFDCFEMGYEHLPSEPTEVGALVTLDGVSHAITVTWKEPTKNPEKVTGYIVLYKPRTQSTFKSVSIDNPLTRQYRLTESKEMLVANMDYKIRVTATADHGVSFGSIEVDIFIPDPSLHESLSKDVDDCCADRHVEETCRNKLCRSKTWSHFSTEDILGCYSYLNPIFTCLAVERNHTNCCAAYDVSSECLPLCAGKPPKFDNSLVTCVTQMNIIEACIQQGYETLPAPPTSLSLRSVSATTAVLEFEPSVTQGLTRYVVQVRNESVYEQFYYYSELGTTGRVASLVDLTPNTYYWVRLIAETQDAGSLPSDTVAFLTYPASIDEPTPPPVINVPHNLTECCINTGMPEICWIGCEYRPNITAYYSTVLDSCYVHIGSVLACAADGRDHTQCCKEREVQPLCQDLCVHTKRGPLDPQYIACIADTPKAVTCYMEGILSLPKHPDNVKATNVSTTTITLTWDHPKTSGRIDLYNITYGIPAANTYFVTTDKTTYILQNLMPNNMYEIRIISINENGTSAPSPVISVYTNMDPIAIIPSINLTLPTGRALWQNITHCCESEVKAECQDSCENKQAATAMPNTCLSESQKMLGCFADGQDHRDCCRQKGLHDTCLPMCGGHALETNFITAGCMSYAFRDIILSCFIENSGLIPGAPGSFGVMRVNEGAVQLSWTKSSYCADDCTYIIHYWKEGNRENTIDITEGVLSPYNVTNLESDARYTFTVAARNSYGSSPPSAWQTIFLSSYDRIVKVILRNDYVWINQGDRAYLYCDIGGFDMADPLLKIQWYFNKARRVGTTGSQSLVIDNVNPANDEGTYTCEVTDSAISSSDTIYLPIKYAPKFDQLKDESAPPGMGQQGKVACWFRGFPDSATPWKKDGVAIRSDSTKYSIGVDERYDTGITAYRLKIADIVESDYGTYYINVSNAYGHAECSVKLMNPDEIDIIQTPDKIVDTVACCAEKNVSKLCQEICTFKVNVSEIIDDPTYLPCLFHFEEIIACGADGQDHSKCCNEAGVLPFCTPFCSGVTPANVQNTEELLQCVSEVDTMFGCAQKGHDLIPYAPESVYLTMVKSSMEITVKWSQPFYSQDRVDHFTIFYNYTGNPAARHISVNELVMSYTITNVEPSTTYHVWVRSGNKHGESQNSTIQEIQTPEDQITRVIDLKATQVENTADIRLTWNVANEKASSGYTVYYKQQNAARYTTATATQKYILLNKLEPDTTYQAYVVVNAGEEVPASNPSDVIYFKTGLGSGGKPSEQKDSGDDDSKKIAIGVGVTLAILAVAAVVFLVVYFVMRGRVFKPGGANDTVAFENPGFGSAGKVQIHGMEDQYDYGRLQEEGVPPAENTFVRPSNGGEFDNPTYQNNPPNPTHQNTPPNNSTDAPTLEVNSHA